MTGQMRNVFVSHIHEDDAHIEALKRRMKIRGMTVRDSSINSSNPNRAQSEAYIKSQILAPRINRSGVVVVLISPNTHSSHWVNWEIEYAQKMNKRIVGVWLPGATQANLPDALTEYADAVVAWRADHVFDAIAGTLNNWEQPDGAPADARPITRFVC